MGARGPRKKLAQIDKLDGNPSNRPIFNAQVEAFGEAFVPEHLPDDARGCIEVVKRSMPPKIYAALDTFVLSAFAMAWAVHKRASHAIADPEFEWIVVNGQGSQSPNPWLRTLNSQAAVMASLGDRLGLNPKARADLKLPAAKPQSKFDGLIGQNGSSPSLNA
ncbi:P27 family phage terminase small subunit [Methylobacterium sp. NEAU 140]|uniref:P27 family phage terminase small subunit n=1 Tax=Methylobacterium sp. NEAU 140 TaxID=3064945 RepID=UPI0027334AE2|nr:P27 family phage terminase small subunit [Methylobacterium sp. NEAU 140]MDP4024449.1 P27 family phage terminase small subunit [Methylobacterium sp. NEAU 140]